MCGLSNLDHQLLPSIHIWGLWVEMIKGGAVHDELNVETSMGLDGTTKA